MSLRPLVVCGPSGVGKGTLLKRLLTEHKDKFALSVSHTTRKPREGEQHGVNYFYVTREEMEADIATGKFIESAVFAGNIYGTSFAAVKKVADEGKICVLEIDVQGAQTVAKSDLNARFVFIEPPSWETLVGRLSDRGTETPESIDARLATARKELDFLKTTNIFEKVIVNDGLDDAYAELLQFACGE